MRPRGLSSSSPSRTYVGQVAVQNPQWVQVRNIFSDAAMSGSASCSAVKSVCTGSLPFDDAPRVQNTARVKSLLDTRGKRSQRGRLRLENQNGLAQRGRAFDQRGMTCAATVSAADRSPNNRGAAVIGARHRNPDEPASPIQIPSGIEAISDGFRKFGAAARRDRNAPDDAVRQLDER